MLKIRREQMHALRLTAEDAFVEEMARHLRAHFPVQLQCLGDDLLRANIRSEMASARLFGLTSRADVQSFLNIGAMLGASFLDPDENKWIRTYLADPEVPEATARMRRLHAAVMRKLEVDQSNREVRAAFESSLESPE